jgi:transposase-like protein
MGVSKTKCRTCGPLGDREYASQKYGWEEDDTHLPSAFASLTLVSGPERPSSRLDQLFRCPECGQHFHYVTDYEFLANGSEDEQTLIRITDAEARRLRRARGR